MSNFGLGRKVKIRFVCGVFFCPQVGSVFLVFFWRKNRKKIAGGYTSKREPEPPWLKFITMNHASPFAGKKKANVPLAYYAEMEIGARITIGVDARAFYETF